jgi:hypothetical protein
VSALRLVQQLNPAMVSLFFSFQIILIAQPPKQHIVSKIKKNYKSFLTLIIFDDNPSTLYETQPPFTTIVQVRLHFYAVGYLC